MLKWTRIGSDRKEMGLVGRTHPAEAGDAPGEYDDGWPEGWTDDELRALAADDELHDEETGCARHGAGVTARSIG
jgi:hypothetical protein